MEYAGIDVSKYQGAVDWAKVAGEADVKFVILRAKLGVFTDSMVLSYLPEVRNHGIPFGLYFASEADNVAEAKAEAEAALAFARENPGFTYGLWYDMEYARQAAYGKKAVTDMLCAWLELVSGAGYVAGIYTNKAWLDSNIERPRIENYPLWYAAYPSTAVKSITDYAKNNRSKLSYPRADIHQWSSNGRVPGISGAVDLNVCYTDFPARTKEKGKTGENGKISAPEADNTPAAWAKEGVEWCVSMGLLTGNENGDLRLREHVTREELCVVLEKFSRLAGNGGK